MFFKKFFMSYVLDYEFIITNVLFLVIISLSLLFCKFRLCCTFTRFILVVAELGVGVSNCSLSTFITISSLGTFLSESYSSVVVVDCIVDVISKLGVTVVGISDIVVSVKEDSSVDTNVVDSIVVSEVVGDVVFDGTTE